MPNFTIRLAEINIGVTALYDDTRRLCAGYLCDDAPDFSVSVVPPDIENERKAAAREAEYEGIAMPDFTNAMLESTAVYRKIAERLPFYDALVFHGSAVAVDGKAYLFTAKSGMGKSTHTALWRRLFGARAVMLNDDKPILRKNSRGQIYVYGTPWDGKHHLSTNAAAPLYGLAVLNRGAENEIKRMTFAEAWPMLMQQSYRPKSADAMRQTIAIIDALAASVPLYSLKCNMDISAAQTAYNVMNGV